MSISHQSSDRITEYYRRVMAGHIYVQDTVDELLNKVARRAARLGPGTRVLELGSHAGIVTEALLERCPELEVIVSDPDEELVDLARHRLAGRRATFHTTRLENLSTSVDLVVSLARHHHLPHDYLPAVRRLMKPHGVYVLADELCPEYCLGEHTARIEQAELIHVAGGYVLTSHAELRDYEDRGKVPTSAIELERLRKGALWRWYRFVVDHAVERGYFDIAESELRSTCDDLVTGSDAEHKLSPLIVEKQLSLSGFQRLTKHVIGPSAPALQSMHVYEFHVGAAS